MNTRPEALRLADELLRYRTVDCCNAAAAELHHLHVLNQELLEANESFAKRQKWWNDQTFELEQRNQELLEALKKYHAKHINTYGLDGAWDEEITLSTKVISNARAIEAAHNIKE